MRKIKSTIFRVVEIRFKALSEAIRNCEKWRICNEQSQRYAYSLYIESLNENDGHMSIMQK